MCNQPLPRRTLPLVSHRLGGTVTSRSLRGRPLCAECNLTGRLPSQRLTPFAGQLRRKLGNPNRCSPRQQQRRQYTSAMTWQSGMWASPADPELVVGGTSAPFAHVAILLSSPGCTDLTLGQLENFPHNWSPDRCGDVAVHSGGPNAESCGSRSLLLSSSPEWGNAALQVPCKTASDCPSGLHQCLNTTCTCPPILRGSADCTAQTPISPMRAYCFSGIMVRRPGPLLLAACTHAHAAMAIYHTHRHSHGVTCPALRDATRTMGRS